MKTSSSLLQLLELAGTGLGSGHLLPWDYPAVILNPTSSIQGLSLKQFYWSIWIFALLLSVQSGLVRGQAISGDVTGTVSDPSGAALPNTDVTATNEATGVKASTTTNEQGVYRQLRQAPKASQLRT